MQLKIKPVNESIKSLYMNHSTYHPGDSGIDLFITREITIPGNALSYIIDLGICCEALDDKQENVGYYLYPRSSMGKTPLRLSNSIGIIDSTYRGNIMAVVDNMSNNEYRLAVGNRLFQLCSADLKPITFDIVNSLSKTERGSGGIGSTGGTSA
ncbi:hypothetical protein CMK20_18895 [Candidatus Poribacteria bacterium]|nr:hypothetical protein [Candidatus Poribacteria bacterium]|tara:strand:- start:496 stop:957 length:462 start_codon:yes stop_codon:yes gene_type:complete